MAGKEKFVNAGATTERVLSDLRQRLVGEAFHPGDRLDPSALARQLGASATPVREALHVLTGERLVEARSGGGFNLPFLDEAGLQDRYQWSGQLLSLAIHLWPRRRKGVRFALEIPGATLIAEKTGQLFMAIGRHSHNSEHGRQIGLLNGRMHRIRLGESSVFTDLEAEMDEMVRTIEWDDRPLILHMLQAYHRKRRKAASEILRAVYNNT